MRHLRAGAISFHYRPWDWLTCNPSKCILLCPLGFCPFKVNDAAWQKSNLPMIWRHEKCKAPLTISAFFINGDDCSRRTWSCKFAICLWQQKKKITCQTHWRTIRISLNTSTLKVHRPKHHFKKKKKKNAGLTRYLKRNENMWDIYCVSI